MTTVSGHPPWLPLLPHRLRVNALHFADPRALTDDPEIYHGAAVGLQVVGRRLQEERVLELTELIGEAIARSTSQKES